MVVQKSAETRVVARKITDKVHPKCFIETLLLQNKQIRRAEPD